MNWKVTFTADAVAALKKVPANLRGRIISKVEALAADPYAKNNNVKALKGAASAYRLRVGDWRVIYSLRDGEMVILVLKIGPRGGVYD